MSDKIVSYKDFVAGWLDSTIHDFLQILPAGEASTKYALITCLDSNRNPASIRGKSPELKPLARKMEVVGNGLLLPTDVLLENEAHHQIFFGFDEVWFIPEKRVQALPPSLGLSGPPRLTRSRLQQLGKWMSANSCSLALGGGEGLNFVVKAHGLVRPLLGLSIEQPDSALVST